MSHQELLGSPAQSLTPAEFFRFCRDHDELRIERDQYGNIEIMPPTGLETGRRNADLIFELVLWNRQHNRGIVGDSSAGYTLPDGAVRSPDASWISNERLSQVSLEDRERFVSAVPEFVAEIRSHSDRPKTLRNKMQEHLDNGVLLSWYIDPLEQRAEIYRASGAVEIIKNLDQLFSGEAVLPGFEFDLRWMK